MHRAGRTIVATLLAVSAECSWAQSEQPDATIDYTGKAVTVGVGYAWGQGILHYKGMDYRFTVNGLSIGDVGRSSVTASGKVFGLTKVEDFPGAFAAATAGASIRRGEAAVAMRNHNGVIIQVSAPTAGAQLRLAKRGVAVTFDGPPTPTAGPSSASRASSAQSGPDVVGATTSAPRATVDAVQRALVGVGLGPLQTDGALGPKTREAIGSFELAHGLPVTGKINARFLQALRQASGEPLQ
jgi:hypothetical protein